MGRAPWWILLCWACSEPLPAPEAANDPGERLVEEGSPDALGVLAFLNDASTSVRVLDIDVALDSRAATNLIAHRDGRDGVFGTADDDRFDDIAEVDAVSYVGESAINRLVAYAQAGGWVPVDNGIYGVVEGVELTDAQADAILDLANTASLTTLDIDVGLDARAAKGIVDKRPFGTVEDVADVPYVGKTAIQAMVAYTAVASGPTVDALEQALTVASDGLWFTSESDYRLTVWSLPPGVGTVTEANAKSVLSAAVSIEVDGRNVEESDLGWFFDRYTVPEYWWEPEQLEAAAQWQSVRDVFEQDLTEVQVFRIGRPSNWGLVGAIDVFVFGRAADGSLVGVYTVSVET